MIHNFVTALTARCKPIPSCPVRTIQFFRLESLALAALIGSRLDGVWPMRVEAGLRFVLRRFFFSLNRESNRWEFVFAFDAGR